MSRTLGRQARIEPQCSHEGGRRSDEAAKDRRQKSSPRAFLVAAAEAELENRGERSLRADKARHHSRPVPSSTFLGMTIY